jgi:DNA ligase (NAD+)
MKVVKKPAEGGLFAEPTLEQPLAGQTIVVTGTLEKLDRKEIEELILSLGGKASGSVSKKTSFLVAGANAGPKLDKAKELKVPVLSEAEFLKKVGR